MSFLYRVYVNSSKEVVSEELNKRRLGKANIVYSMNGEEELELSRRGRIRGWEEEEIFSIDGIVNVKEL